jgi:small-conductance mechanosensitive channel
MRISFMTIKRQWTSRRLVSFVILLVVLLDSGLTFSQNPPESAPKAPDILAYLTETINWYRGTVVEQQIANEPGDMRFLDDNRRISSQIVRLAFDFARLEEQNESKEPKGSQAQDQANSPSRHQRLLQAAAIADQQVEQSQNELRSLRQELETAPKRMRASLDSQIAEAQSELEFRQARRDALRNMLQFATETTAQGMGATGLRAQIEELARSVPDALSDAEETLAEQNTTGRIPESTSLSANTQQPSGIWELAASLLRLSHKGHTLDERIRSTNQLMQKAKQLREPSVANLRGLIQSGDQIANQPPSRDPSVLAQQKKQLDTLTAQFKQSSAGLLPLRKQGILLNLYKKTIENWRAAVGNEYGDRMRSFLVRLAILVIIIALVFAAGKVWRRAILRYIQETRRRYQFLLFGKIMIWIAVSAIIAFTFTTELGSVATFAGLLTAGVAVAMQNVLLSVAGYFFLIGKYGIRIGDRVQIAGVTGEVVDIGLVRLHLLELASGGTDAQPSGRVVAFSNSIVFQPTSGVFKQIPGTSFIWHEVNLAFSPENNYRMIQERMANAVDIALKDHRAEMERQMRHMEKTLSSIHTIELRPKTGLRFTSSGIEVTVRFPVALQNAAEIDDGVMRELRAAIEQEPKLRLAESGMPRLRTDPPSPTPA